MSDKKRHIINIKIPAYLNAELDTIKRGSGTTGLVIEKLQNNKRWIGIEISERYCEIAKKRIEAEAMQIKMSL